MGEVWKARDTRVDRIVAVKVSKQEFSQRFEREARAVAALSHSNICPLFDVGPNYLVFEFVEGQALELSKGDANVHYLLGELMLRHSETMAEGLQHLRAAALSIREANQALMQLQEVDK